MGFRELFGIDELERENEVLHLYIREQNRTLQSIYQLTRKYQKENPCIAYVGFQKIQNLTELALDYAVEKEIGLTKHE